MTPDNMTCDKSPRTYIRGSALDPLLQKPDASRHLSQLRSIADGILDPSDAWIGIDTGPAASRAQDQQIVLLNAAELDARTPASADASGMEG